MDTIALIKNSTNKNKNHRRETNNVVSTVLKNMEGFTQIYIESAREACNLFYNFRCPTTINFKLLTQMNMIQNLPINTQDVDSAKHIWGLFISVLKSKTTQRRT